MSVIIQDNYAYEILNKNLSMEMSGMLANEQLLDKQPEIVDRFRSIVNDWIFSVSNMLKTSIKTYHLSVTYFDILLQRKNILRDDLQMYGLMCLNLATKMNEIYYPDIDTYSRVSNNTYTVAECVESERDIYDILNHKLIVPTLYNFTELYINLLKRNVNFTWTADEQHLTNAIISFIYMTNTDSLKYLSSLIALSSIIVSKNYFNQETNYIDLIHTYFKNYSFSYDELLFGYSIVRKIMNLYSTSKLTSVKDYINEKIGSNDLVKYFSNLLIDTIIVPNNLLRPVHQYVKNEILENLDKVNKIGSGKYGSVYKIKINSDYKAFKSMLCKLNTGIEQSTLREISILNYVSHANLLDLESSTYDSKKKCYGVVFEFMERDLKSILETTTDYQIKRFSSQLIQAVEYLHSNGIIHRDIRFKNILIKGNDIKLADYGVSRSMVVKSGEYTLDTFPLVIKPIEILLDVQKYGFSSDIWQCGCVIGGMIKHDYLVGSDSELDTIYSILLLFGSKRVREAYPDTVINLMNFNGSGLKSGLKTDDDLAVDLLEYIFEMNHIKRPTAKLILNHPWFMS